MKKRFLVVSLLCGMAAGAMAWSESPVENLLVSGPEAVGQDLPLAVPGPDGSTYVCWLSWEDESASLKMQLLDKNGEPELDEGGVYVSQYLTPTWSSGYDIASDADGNLFVAYSDKRNGVWQTYVYKLDSNGEKQWGDGVAVADLANESCLNPRLMLTDAGNVVVAYQSLVGVRNTIKVAKLLSDGSKAWGGVIELTGTNGLYSLADAGGDSFYVAYLLGDAGKMAVMRYTANGEAAWEDAVIVDETAVVSAEPMACPNGKGGVLLGWRHSLGGSRTSDAVQVVDRDGKPLWDEILNYPVRLSLAASRQGDIYVSYIYDSASTGINLTVSKYGADGKLLWDGPLLLDGQSYQVSIYGSRVTDNGEFAVVYRNASNYNEATIEYSYFDAAGEIVDTQVEVSVMDGDKGRGALSYGGGRQMVLVWGDNGMANGKGSVYAQNILLPESASVGVMECGGTHLQAVYTGSSLKVNVSGKADIYDCAGRLLFSGVAADGTVDTPALMPGLYVIKINGQSAKFTVL